MADYLHNHKDFPALLRIVGSELHLEPGLVEKDYWIMHSLYGLNRMGYKFELKGGTSLSKGYGIIHRFSEDIDLHIKPPVEAGISENLKNNKPKNIQARKDFYERLSKEIKIDGITDVIRDHAFDNEQTYRSGGIRLLYTSYTEFIEGVKEGILLEAGFETVTPNNKLTISSWAYDKAINQKVSIIDNRAIDIACYHPGYTFVEKLQTIVTKFRQEQETGIEKANLMRQYYDVYCLLDNILVQEFLGTEEYELHKKERFPLKDYAIPLTVNQAFLFEDSILRTRFEERYIATEKLYYKGQPPFEDIMKRIGTWIMKC
jgi:predicted nucleotidyltransferase component of viral defense system